jgi:hypothetical protein
MLDIIYKVIDEVIFQTLFNKNITQNDIEKHPYYLDISDIE